MDNLPYNNPNSYAGHGTNVAGIIGAIANNSKDVSGVMWNCKILPIKMVRGTSVALWPFVGTIHDFSTTALPSDVANAIDYAVNNGAHIINLSYGFTAIGFPIDQVILRMPLLYSTIANAYNNNVVVVAAMGNDYEKGNPIIYPAGFANEVIAVGSTTQNIQRAQTSSTGKHIDVSAPGTNIMTTIRGGGSGTISGTSMAAPVVSAIAGLIISQGLDRGFNLTNDDVRHILEETADDISPVGWDSETGYGKVNAYRALNLLNYPNVLYHNISTGGTSVKIKSLDKWLYFGPRWGLSSGVYLNVDQYQITKRITFDIPFCSVPKVWLRERESVCMSFAIPNDGFPFCQITNISTTGFDVRYAAYYVGYNINMTAINKWIPSNPASTKIAYTTVGVPNPAAAAGPFLGESVICSSNSAYILQNLPSGCTISWNKSPNISYVSGQNTNNYVVKANGNGQGWVEATVNSDCGNPILLQKTVWLGSPSQPLKIIGFSNNGKHFGSNLYYEFSVNPTLNQGTTQYEWVVGGGTIEEGQGTSQITVLTYNAGEINMNFDVSVRARNNCGWSPWLWRTGYVVGGAGPAYVAFPNPTTNIVSITSIKKTENKHSESKYPEPIKKIQIFDKMGFQVLLQYYSGNDCKVNLNLSDLKKGVYFVIINEKASLSVVKE